MEKRRVYLYPDYPKGIAGMVWSGIYRYAIEHGWDLVQLNPHLYDLASRTDGLRRVGKGGLIIFPNTKQDLEQGLRMGLPVVSVSSLPWFHRCPQVGIDNRICGHMAGEYLRSLGLRSLGFFSSSIRLSTPVRWAGLRDYARKEGLAASFFSKKRAYPGPENIELSRTMPDEKALCHWLLSLPKPCGIFTADALASIWIHRCCATLSLHIPRDVALLTHEDDPGYCMSVSPPISAMKLPCTALGHLAAETLDRLCNRKTAPSIQTLQPEGVTPRQSTDVLHTDRSGIGAAISYIRTQACAGANPAKAAALAGCCRRSLDTIFNQLLGHSVFQEIRRVQIETTKNLLLDRSLTLEEIAARCNFSSQSHLSREFKAATGINPGAWRNRADLPS